MIVTIKECFILTNWLICPHVYENAQLHWKEISHLHGKITPFLYDYIRSQTTPLLIQMVPVNSRFVNTMWNILGCTMQNSNQCRLLSYVPKFTFQNARLYPFVMEICVSVSHIRYHYLLIYPWENNFHVETEYVHMLSWQCKILGFTFDGSK